MTQKMMKKLLLLALFAPLAACASVGAKSPADRPALDVPPPPPRLIEPAAPVETEPEPVGELPPPPAPNPPKPRPQREGPREPAKPEQKPEAPAEPTPQPVPPVQPAESQLRTPGTADGAEASRQVREILDRTRNTLNTIDYRTLSEERRKAYNEAKDFMQGAEDAVKKQNYVFARSLAEKAEKLVRELQGR